MYKLTSLKNKQTDEQKEKRTNHQKNRQVAGITYQQSTNKHTDKLRQTDRPTDGQT